MRFPLRAFVVIAWLASALPALAQTRVSITIGPPAIPVYEQPLCPGDGFIWTPGYWAWDDLAGGYYWVPGTWIRPPAVGLLWTPGYWLWRDTSFTFVNGYWGPVVGFYGGIDYGFGYPGHGFYGGRWTSGRFFYNRSVSNVNVTNVHNTYVENVKVVNTSNRVSYNGGKDGIVARPTDRETAAAKERHVPATSAQEQHAQHARTTPDLHAAVNDGKPPVPATARPEALQGRETGAAGNGSSRDPSPTARNSERSQPQQQARPQTRSQQPPASQPPASRAPSSPSAGRAPSSDDRTPSRDDRAQSHEDRSRDEHSSKTRPAKKRDGEREQQD
jgi:hypothetical protein